VTGVKESSVQTMPVQQVREGWRGVLDAARFHRTTTVITYHDEPVAMLVPPDGHRDQGVGGQNVGGTDGQGAVTAEVGVGEARLKLRELVDAARDGHPTVIVRHGSPVASLVSYAPGHATHTEAASK
jgi:prevent-host-death family protein